ncbi:MAG: hypothetical protein IKX50_00930 [Spirochaetia bacterium]|nr:hypothetical protein [Spirochaetia bacterium]
MEASEAKTWESAVCEWEIFDCEEDEDCSTECICGHEGLKYLYTIRNRINGNILFPIGSSCIKKFERFDLNEKISILEQMYNLLHAVDRGERIELTSKLFSSNLLLYFYKKGVFKPNYYNGFDSYNDYEFMLKMFRKRNKNTISQDHHKKINAIIIKAIKPYLRETLKVRKRNGN